MNQKIRTMLDRSEVILDESSSTMDLLEMYHGTYHPYWMPKKDKKKETK